MEPPDPALSLIEPEVSSTRAISSSMPLATEWTLTGMVVTPRSLAKFAGTLAVASTVAVIVVRSRVALVTVNGVVVELLKLDWM